MTLVPRGLALLINPRGTILFLGHLDEGDIQGPRSLPTACI